MTLSSRPRPLALTPTLPANTVVFPVHHSGYDISQCQEGDVTTHTRPFCQLQTNTQPKGQHSLELPCSLTCCGERDAAVYVLGTLPLALGVLT